MRRILSATPFVAGSVWGASPVAAFLTYAAAAAVCAVLLQCLVADTRRLPMPDELTSLSLAPDADAAAEGDLEMKEIPLGRPGRRETRTRRLSGVRALGAL